MSEHPNAALLRRLYHGDRQALFERMAPEYVLHYPGNTPASGDFHGKEGHLEHVALLTAYLGGFVKFKIANVFLADDSWGVVPGRVTGARNGLTIDLPAFGLWRFRDGLAAEHWPVTIDHEQLRAFLA